MLNMTSLVDMLLVLVLFFMLTTVFSETEGIEIDFGSAKSKSNHSVAGDTIFAKVSSGGIVYLNGRRLDYGSFKEVLSRLLLADANRQIVLEVGENITVQELVTGLDLVQLAGGKNVLLSR